LFAARYWAGCRPPNPPPPLSATRHSNLFCFYFAEYPVAYPTPDATSRHWAPIPYFNKMQIISLFQDGLSHSKISERLGIGRSTISAIIKKWRQDQTVERRPGSGGRRISTRNQDEQLLTVIRNSPFTTATAAVNISNFPGSIRTSTSSSEE
jgi:biotin operon repressor